MQVQHGGVRLDSGGESVDVREGQGRQGALQYTIVGIIVEIITINVLLFKKLRDIIFFGGRITL